MWFQDKYLIPLILLPAAFTLLIWLGMLSSATTRKAVAIPFGVAVLFLTLVVLGTASAGGGGWRIALVAGLLGPLLTLGVTLIALAFAIVAGKRRSRAAGTEVLCPACTLLTRRTTTNKCLNCGRELPAYSAS